MASSFGATTIRAERDPSDWSRPRGDVVARVSVRPVPGSNDRVVQVLGVDDADRTHRLDLDAAEFAALVAQVGTEAVLTLADEAQGTFLLASLTDVRHQVGGRVSCQASFLRTGA